MEAVTEMHTTSTSFANVTQPANGNSYPFEAMRYFNIACSIIYSLAFVVGILGNGVVIWVTGFKMKKTVNTVWFLNLAVADFFFTACLPLTVIYMAMNFHWPFGRFLCKLNTMLFSLNFFASMYILVMISVDRCVSVVLPIWAQNHRCVRKAAFVSLAVWVLALILSTPRFVFRDTTLSNGTIICFDNYAFSDDYKTPAVQELRAHRLQAIGFTRFLLGFFIPFAVIVSCNGVLIHQLRRNRTMARRARGARRPFKIIAAVIITFFLCWAPLHISLLIEVIYHTTDLLSPATHSVAHVVVPVTYSLAFINSSLNPLLYASISRSFKKEIHNSILHVFENAFEEHSSSFNHDHKVTNITQSE